MRFQIQHNKKNVIDVEETTSHDEDMLPPPAHHTIEMSRNPTNRQVEPSGLSMARTDGPGGLEVMEDFDEKGTIEAGVADSIENGEL